MKQDQFLQVIDRDEAERRFHEALNLLPLPAETVPLAEALYRVLAEDIVAALDVPGFDRSNVDGFAVRAEDTFGASEDQPIILQLNSEVISTGVQPCSAVVEGTATAIATGAVVPRGADAVVMVEYTDADDSGLSVVRPVTPGANITFAGTDISRGETVLRRGELVTSRETGVLAALGATSVSVVRKPTVAILSTGNEIIAPGEEMKPGLVYDSNAVILANAVQELGGQPIEFGIVPDDADELRQTLERALDHDVVLLSGGTSKGEGDLSYRVVASLGKPGILAHGVALKPGKPLCLAAVRRGERVIPVIVLPGFPTSAIFTFHEFVAPVIRRLAGRQQEQDSILQARVPHRIKSERGRTEYLLVGLIKSDSSQARSPIPDPRSSIPDLRFPTPDSGPPAWLAYPMGKGSGSVTTFSRADGFIVIPRQHEYVAANAVVSVHLLDRNLKPADLVVIGSHCVGLDYLLGQLHERGWRTKFLATGSSGGLEAARRGECDVAGVHLFHAETGLYNQPFLTEGLTLLKGYRRLQGLIFRPGDPRFEGHTVETGVKNALADSDCVLVNRNKGSGTRILIDELLASARPPGYFTEAKSHNAVVAAIAQQRADWGLAIVAAAEPLGLHHLPVQEEHFDFVIPSARRDRPAVQAFLSLLQERQSRVSLQNMGFVVE